MFTYLKAYKVKLTIILWTIFSASSSKKIYSPRQILTYPICTHCDLYLVATSISIYNKSWCKMTQLTQHLSYYRQGCTQEFLTIQWMSMHESSKHKRLLNTNKTQEVILLLLQTIFFLLKNL